MCKAVQHMNQHFLGVKIMASFNKQHLDRTTIAGDCSREHISETITAKYPRQHIHKIFTNEHDATHS